MKRAALIVLTLVLTTALATSNGGAAAAQSLGVKVDDQLNPLPLGQYAEEVLLRGGEPRSMSDDGEILLLGSQLTEQFVLDRATGRRTSIPNWSGYGTRLTDDGTKVLLFPAVGFRRASHQER